MKVKSLAASPASLKVFQHEYADTPVLKLALKVVDHWPAGGKVKTGKVEGIWTSSDPSVVQVIGNQIQGIAKGKAVLSCSNFGKTKTVPVKVKARQAFDE